MFEAGAEQHERSGQQGEGRQHRNADHQRSADTGAAGLENGAQQQAEKADHHRDAGPCDGLPGARHGVRDDVDQGRTDATLAVIRDHEQRIVDADRQADHGHDIAQQIGHWENFCKHEGGAQSDRRSGEPHQERQARGDQGAESHHQNDERERQRVLLRAVAALRAQRIHVVIRGGPSRDRELRLGVELLQVCPERRNRAAHLANRALLRLDVGGHQPDEQHRHATVRGAQLRARRIGVIRDLADRGQGAEHASRVSYPVETGGVIDPAVRQRDGDDQRVDERIGECRAQCFRGRIGRASRNPAGSADGDAGELVFAPGSERDCHDPGDEHRARMCGHPSSKPKKSEVQRVACRNGFQTEY